MSGHLHGVAAREFARRELDQLLVNPLRWEVLWWRPEPFEVWLETFPQASAHGGGPAAFQPIDINALDELTSLVGWECPEEGPLIRFLIHRTRGRSALRPLRDLLDARLVKDADEPTDFRHALGRAFLLAPGALRPSERALIGRLMLGCDERRETRGVRPQVQRDRDHSAPDEETASQPARPTPVEEPHRYPLSNLLPDWRFRVEVTSEGVYLMEGADPLGRMVSRRGTDRGAMLAACVEDAASLDFLR